MTRPAAFDRYEPQLEAELKRAVGDSTSPLYAMLRYQMGWTDYIGMPETFRGGKRTLGTLALLATSAVGGHAERALPAAAAVELAQAFAQLHREVQEGTPGEQHRPALWWVWSSSQAINAGDGVYALARLQMMGLAERGLPAETVAVAMASLDQACLELCEGQHRSIEAEGRSDLTPEEYVRVMESTAGALPGCAAAVGALIAGAGPGTVGGLGRFGRMSGVAWRLRREIEAFWDGTPAARSRFVEALDAQRSLPVVHGLATVAGDERQRLDALPRRDQPLADADVDAALAVLDRHGSKDFCSKMIDRYLAWGLEALASARLHSGGEAELGELATYLAGRGSR